MNDNTFNNDRTQATPDSLNQGLTLGSRGVQKSQFSPGDLIESRYQIISVIGQGGFGCVYKVHQVLLNKQFALKTLNPIHASQQTILRLQKEAQAAGRLEHRNLVRAVDFGMIDGVQPFLVMDLVKGPTLAEYLKEHGKLSVAAALDIFIPLTQALAYAHGQGVVHRDLKPSNVILAIDDIKPEMFVPKIVDFGIAKIQSGDENHALSLTSTGDVFGTPLYMSPEQCAGTAVDTRSDIYSLGCMLFEALTGAPPFRGRNPLEVMMQHGTGVLPSLKEASMGETFPRELERIITAMLAKNPDERYSNCQRLAEDLSWLQHGEFERISTLEQTGAIVIPPPRPKQSPFYLPSIAAACIMAGVFVGYSVASLRMTPTAPVKVDPMTENRLDLNPINLDAEDVNDFYSQTKGGTTTFNFGWPNTLGTLYWWDLDGLKQVQAAKTQTVPKNARLIFVASGNFYRQPDLWARFHQNELYGVVVLPRRWLVNQDSLNQSIRQITQQDSLRILSITNKSMSLRALRSIGDIPHLSWLDISNCEIDKKAMYGKELQAMKWLQDLHVLKVDKVTNSITFLSRLAEGSVLRRLSLSHAGLKDEDIEVIGKLQSLEILSLRTCTPKVSVLGHILKLKRLKGFVLDPALLEIASPAELQRLKGLTIIVSRNAKEPPSEAWKRVLANLHGCHLIESVERAEADGDWFDPLKEDPGKSDI